MKKAVFTFSILLYLFSSTEFKQLLKFPIVIEHYFEHVQENENLSLVEYITIHYVEDFVIDDDVARDMELPFKGCDHTQTTIIYALELNLKHNTSVFLDTYSEPLHLTKEINFPPVDFV
ncbi:hypothetical protein EP331_00505, partial [bacterium]